MKGFHCQISSLEENLGVSIVLRAPAIDVSNFLSVLSIIGIEPGENYPTEDLMSVMNWTGPKAKSSIETENLKQKAILFKTQLLYLIRELYDKTNEKDHDYPGDRKIIQAIKTLEEENMWVPSLKANPNHSDTPIIAVVWGSLNDHISMMYDDDHILDVEDDQNSDNSSVYDEENKPKEKNKRRSKQDGKQAKNLKVKRPDLPRILGNKTN